MKWALVVGASGDIGEKIALDLAKDGWSLYLHANTGINKVNKLIEKLRSEHQKQDFLQIKADFNDLKQVEGIMNQLFSLDALIFAQGTTHYGLFSQSAYDNTAEIIQMQVLSPLRLIQLLEDKLAKNGYGRIVFLGSVYGGSGSAMEVAYSTAKGALAAFAKAYSKEVASLGITVNVIAPGAVDTKMNSLFSDSQKEEIDEQIPMGRFASADEISYWVKVALEEQAGYLTGQTIYVTGGWLK
ncbi:SDR family oxidoreductase [Liquorilactobacillus mali]|uniref:3-oxoacyl-acyl carrier protein reductase n=1 Tax=Liquorilactobacillus mali TaxID=1618 RepID=A0A0R2FVR1_9LACO|nr:SDR family NAD(P)-dependent oxidoreductase [Liquorilactobacillus mali]KRN31526.1 3-oxoacyl-acyl carrier protein reductase [Liquorilactobacillus mali]MDN7145321.1 SDR family oxidoreductase [Liquorilactobacillus mali]